MESCLTTTADYAFHLYRFNGQWWATDKLVSSLTGVPVLDLHRMISEGIVRIEGHNLIRESTLNHIRGMIPRRYQQAYGQLVYALHSRNTGRLPEADILQHDHPVRIESGMCCMTDLYSAYLASPNTTTSNRNCKPSHFLRLKKSRELVARLARSRKTPAEELFRTSRDGGHPAKWTIREIAQSYAAWLSKPLGMALADRYAQYEQKGGQ
ncbi:hypothetical protein GCM10023116_48530 [Kistimonas scapharcae]|uniref:KilA-N domain-containing protein n=1 Tax=Kistimonas scapharcae TaxID=1036133 RepID=A0ABP8V9D8_9GAMM